VLDASYEAVLTAAAIEMAQNRGSGKVLLTFLGGGVFGNSMEWIEGAICRACAELSHTELEVVVCHYRCVDDAVAMRIDGTVDQLVAERAPTPPAQ